jgi:ribosomal protein L37E
MYCKQCGKEIDDGSQYCSYCGAGTGFKFRVEFLAGSLRLT